MAIVSGITMKIFLNWLNFELLILNGLGDNKKFKE